MELKMKELSYCVSTPTREFCDLTEGQARKKAIELCLHTSGSVFIDFYRYSDSQSGYLNRAGHELSGKNWNE